MTIRAGIVGYGNLGRSVEKLVKLQPDMELVGICLLYTSDAADE